jgi:glucose/arabinose dehydrogenase
MKQVRLTVLLACLLPTGAAPAQPIALQPQVLEHRAERWTLQRPANLRLEILTTDLEGPRLMYFMPNGDLLIGSNSGNLYRLPPPYRDPQVLVRLSGYPHSVAYREGELLIARTTGLYAVPYKPGQASIAADDVRLVAALPGGGGHSSRTVAIGPDQRVYVALGISGNCNDEFLGPGYAFTHRRGGVLVLDESGDTPQLKPFATGLRNPVGIDWHPVTGELYASNNGPDHLGFEQPPEYFTRLTEGSFHGMPWYRFDGQRILRDTCNDTQPPLPLSAVRGPAATFPARNAPMGVAFVPAGALDKRFTHNAIVALRGSWATRPGGGFRGDPATRRPPRLMMVQFDYGRATGVVDVVRGFQRPDGKRLARPVGVATGPDGALYFTSDAGLHGLFRLSVSGADKP